MYTPKGCVTLKDTAIEQQIRLGIQGYPGSGKTWSALTFPNSVIANLDRGLGAHIGRADVIEVPLWDFGWCSKNLRHDYHPNRLKDELIKFLETEVKKLSAEQTFILDGNTGLQNAYHRWWEANKNSFLTQGGSVDSFKEWSQKKNYFGEIMEMSKTWKCNFVYLCHEADQKDKNGVFGASYSGKVRPMLTGAFGDELPSHFTDYFRQHAKSKPINFDVLPEGDLKRDWMMTRAEFKKFCDGFPRNTYYCWQTDGDDVFDGKASSLVNFPKYIPATYESFIKYRRKISV